MPGSRPVIMPAPTVALVIGSIRMKLPMVRLRRYGSQKIGFCASITTAPISFNPNSAPGSFSRVFMLMRYRTVSTVARTVCVACLSR